MSSARLRLAWLLGGCLGLVLTGAPPVSAARLPVRHYTTADGLPHDRVQCITQDARGFLWFGTPEGLSRFDGHRFTNLAAEHGLPRGAVRAFVEAGERFWVGTEDGLCVFTHDAARCTPHTVAADPASRRVFALLADRERRVWAGTDGGLYRTEPRGDTFTPVSLPGGARSRVVAIAQSEDGTIWVGGRGGLWRAMPGRTFIRQPSGPPVAIALLPEGTQKLWVGHPGGLGRLDLVAGSMEVRVRHFSRGGGPAQNVRALARSPDGTVWAGLQNAGLWEVTAATTRRHTMQSGLASNAVRALHEDRDGNLWIGTEGRGVLKLARRGLVSYGRDDGLRNTRIMSVFGDAAGDVYVHTGAAALQRFKDGRWAEAVLPLRNGIRGPFGFGWRVVLHDSSGAWWMGTAAGLLRMDGVGRFTDLDFWRPSARFSADPEGGRAPAGPLFLDARGDLWAGAVREGTPRLLRWTRAEGTTRAYSLPRGTPPSARVRCFAQDGAGALWIGMTEGGLVRLRGGRAEAIALGRGVGTIRDVFVDRAGRVWVASDVAGLGRIDHPGKDAPEVAWTGRAEGLASDAGHCLTEDRWGRLYVGTALGVTRLDPSTGRMRHYGTSDGLASGEVNSAFTDRRGRVWFGTTDGVSVLTPALEPAADPPAVYIAGLRIAGIARPGTLGGTANVPPFDLGRGEAQVEIDYGSLALGLGEKLRYQYRLEGADDHWNAPTERRTVSYAHLAPGSYRFAVQAINADGVASRAPTVVAFRVLPAIWQRGWFLSAIAVGLAGAGYAVFRYRLGMLLEVERVRLRVAADLHDDIGSNLSKIAILSEVAQRQDASARETSLTQIADMARQLVDSMSDIVWAVNPNRDTLHDLSRRMRAFATELFSAMDVALRFEGPDDTVSVRLAADLRRQVFLIFKEAVTNAAAHARARHVDVELRLDRGTIELRVADDGAGFDMTAGGDGHGLQSLRERARAIDGALEVRSQPGQGTVVGLKAPLSGRRRRGHYLTM